MLAHRGAVDLPLAREIPSERDQATIARLRDELRALKQERAALWQRLMPAGRVPAAFGLSPSEAAMLGVFLVNDHCTRELLFEALFHDASPMPDPRLVHVMVCKIRSKVRPYGVYIETFRGFGWSMRPADKARVRALMVAEAKATGRSIADYVAVDLAAFPFCVPKLGGRTKR